MESPGGEQPDQTVRFVYGSEEPAVSYVLSMSLDGNKWRVEIPQTVNDMYRFTFVGGVLEEGEYAQKFSDFKELFCSGRTAGCFMGRAADRNADNGAKLIVQYQFDSRLSMSDAWKSFIGDQRSYNDES